MRQLSELRMIVSSANEILFRHSDCHKCNATSAMQTPGQRIKLARERAGYFNQGEFAKLCGLRQSTLSEIESGETKLPNAKAALTMCELLGVTLRWIIYGEDGEINIPTKQEQELLNKLRAMDDKSRNALLEMARAIPPAASR